MLGEMERSGEKTGPLRRRNIPPAGETKRTASDYLSFGVLTFTFGTSTSFFSVVTLGTLTVSFTVPVSTLGVFTVSVSFRPPAS